MPKADPKEFTDDVVGLAQRCEAGPTVREIAGDFDISEAWPQNWLKQARSRFKSEVARTR